MPKKLTTLAALAALAVIALPAPAAAEQVPLPALIHLPHYPLEPVPPSSSPVALNGQGSTLNVSYTYGGKTQTLEDFLKRSSALSFLVLRGDRVVTERYFAGQNADSRFNSWSVGKSVTAAALGVAAGDGLVDPDEPVDRYVPELKGSGYAGVRVRDVLHMSSGVKWDETNYFNVTTGATAAQLRVAFGTPMTNVAKETVREREPGTKFNYSSLDTFVLGWVLSRAAKRPLADYVRDRIWKPAGMGSTLYLGKDWAGNGLGYCCFHVTARDLGRFGLLYLNGGVANGRRVVPAAWVRDSTRVTVPRNRPEVIDQHGWGYGAQWWTGGGEEGDYSAIGVFGQYVYVDPARKVVIVKTSQDVNSDATMAETLPAFRAVARAVAGQKGRSSATSAAWRAPAR